MSRNQSAVLRVSVPVLCVLALWLIPGSANAGLGQTTVSLRVLTNGTLYKYKVKVKSDKSSCRKHRKVTVWHDEDANQNFDAGEYVLGSGKSNKKGKFKFVTSVVPPEGENVGVLVAGTNKCQEFEESHPLN